MSETTKALTEEQIQKEELLGKIRLQAQEAFPENKVERDGKRIVVTSTSESFLPVEVRKVDGLCAIYGLCYLINASVRNGLQFIIF